MVNGWILVNGLILVMMKATGEDQDKEPHLVPPLSLMAEAPMSASVSSQIDSISSAPSHWAILGPSWKGFSEIRYLFILYVSFAYAIHVPPPTNGLPEYGSSNILINHLAETRTARHSTQNHGLFCTLERISQTKVTLKVVSSLLLKLVRKFNHFYADTNSSQHRCSFSKELKQKFHLQTPPNNLLRQMSFR